MRRMPPMRLHAMTCTTAALLFALAACDGAEPAATPDAEIAEVAEDTDNAEVTEIAEDTEVAEDTEIAEDTGIAEDTSPADTAAETDAPADPAAALIAEGEALFFRALAGETALRAEAIDTLAAGLAVDPEHARGQLLYGMAQLSAVAEDGNLFAALQAQPALEKAMALAPEDLRIVGWLGTVKVGAARALGIGLDEAIAFMIDAADAYPEFNNVSLAIAFGRFPLDTPYPQMAIDRLLAVADCGSDHDVCRNTARVPHNNEGALMLFGDVYARVGDRDKARYYYELALASPDAATWDYAGDAQAVLDDLDERIDLYLDADPLNDPLFFAEGRVACVACHAP